MTFGEKLKKIREERNLTQEQLGNILGTSKQVISRYENGHRSPSVTIAASYAERLGIDIGFLADDKRNKPDSEAFNVVNFPEMHPVPIYGTVAASFGICAVEDALGFEYTDRKDYENCCWLLVKGQSMEPEIHEGDFVLINKDCGIENGDIVAARIDEDDGTIKKYDYENGILSLRPINPACTPKMFAGKDKKRVRIVGKVVEVKRKY